MSSFKDYRVEDAWKEFERTGELSYSNAEAVLDIINILTREKEELIKQNLQLAKDIEKCLY